MIYNYLGVGCFAQTNVYTVVSFFKTDSFVILNVRVLICISLV